MGDQDEMSILRDMATDQRRGGGSRRETGEEGDGQSQEHAMISGNVL